MKIFIVTLCIIGLAWALPSKSVESEAQPNQPPQPNVNNNNLVAVMKAKRNATRVIQGDSGSLSHAPYTVSIGVTGHLCTGSIIGTSSQSTYQRQWVLTTASCVAGLPEKLIRIRYSSEYPNFGGKFAQASRVIVHPSFSRSTMQNDIALIRTVEPMPYSSWQANLPYQNSNLPEGAKLYFNGWGVPTEESGLQSPTLRQIQISTLDYYYCDNNYQSTVGLRVDYYAHLCAGDLWNGGKGFCTGDIGGPLYDYNGYYGAADTIWGLASFSVGCGRPGYPGIYTRVANYRSWIDQTLSGNGGSDGGTTSWYPNTTPWYPNTTPWYPNTTPWYWNTTPW